MKAVKKTKVTSDPSHSYHAEKHLRKFCTVTSHELSNVLGAIVGELDFGLTSNNPAIRNQAMEVALSAAERALTLARNLRYFAVHTRLDVHSADVSQVVLDAVDILEKDLEKRGIQVSVFVDASTFAMVDTGAIAQVVLNLLLNAAWAMPDGGKVSITLKQLPKTIELCIEDTGVGIEAKGLEHLFEPYFFSDGRTRAESLGLGLAVTKALIEAHGGEISVESKVNEGTKFTMSLPFDASMPRPTPFAEKRRFRRVGATFPVDITLLGNEVIQSELITLSIGGCFVILPDGTDLVEPHQVLGIRIHYYNNAFIDVPKARVANLCRVGSQSGMGIEFEEVSHKAKKVLAALVKSHAS